MPDPTLTPAAPLAPAPAAVPAAPAAAAPAPTLADVAAAPPETFSLKAYRAVASGEKTAAEVLAPPVDPRPRDAQGRFMATVETPAAAPTVQVPAPDSLAPAAPIAAPAPAEEDDETKAPQTVSAFEKRLAKERWKRGEVERERDALRARLAPPPAPVPAPPPRPGRASTRS